MANEEGKGEPGKPKPALVRLGQNGAIGKGAETKIGTGSPFGSRLHSFKVRTLPKGFIVGHFYNVPFVFQRAKEI